MQEVLELSKSTGLHHFLLTDNRVVTVYQMTANTWHLVTAYTVQDDSGNWTIQLVK